MTARDTLARHVTDAVCHLATVGRRTGRWRVIEIWFAGDEGRVYLLAGGRERAQWVRNVVADPRVRVRLGGTTLDGRARIVDDADEDAHARRLVATKYGEMRGSALSRWAATSLPVAVELASDDADQASDGEDRSSRPSRPGGQ